MKQAYFKYIFALLLFGTNGIVANSISLTSYEIVFLRTLIGSLFLIIMYLLSKRKITFLHHKKELIFLAVSGISMGASWMFLYEAYQQIGVSISSLAYYCGPIIVMMLSPVLFHEKLTKIKISGFLSVLAGLFLVNGSSLQAGSSGFGIFCGAMSAVMYAFMVIFNKKVQSIKGLENSMLQLTISFLTVALFIGAKQGFIIHVAATDWFPIIFLGLVNTGIGCYLYFSPLSQIPVQTVSICGYLEPLSAVVFSALFLKEKLTCIQIAGAVLILSGAIFAECSPMLKTTLNKAPSHKS